jgi:hypothetical protein
MAIPSTSSPISLAGIKAEIDEGEYNASANVKAALTKLATTTSFNTNSSSYPNASAPHAISEWAGYDHDASASFADSYAVSKTISTGSSNAITFVDAVDGLNFTGTSEWTISFWIKVGWSSSLNTNIHLLTSHRSEGDYQLEDGIKILYNESNNRIQCRYGNKAEYDGDLVTWYKDAQWLFHSNSGAYAAGYAAAGLGAAYWSASNRGYVGDNDYTLITITKAETNNASSLTLYWNATSAGAAPLQTNAGTANVGNIPMSQTDDRLWSLGSRGVYGSTDQDKSGNSAATVYNDITIWNKTLSASEVTELYNSGEPEDVLDHSAVDNLVGYWKFEGNGTDAEGSNDWTISGASGTVGK